MKSEVVNKILSETEVGYDSMAEKFSQTRKFFWRGLEFIKDYAEDGDRVLDFGCGNGRLLELFSGKKINYTGVDISQKLIDLAGQKYGTENIKFSKISGSDSLAFPNNSFKSVYSIAVFHHLPKAQAVRMAQELGRVTQGGGVVVITVWNLWQKKYGKNILQNWLNKILHKSDLDWNDCFISFKDNEGKIFQRYHHAWRVGELRSVFEQAGFQVEKCEVIHRRNILLIGKKT